MRHCTAWHIGSPLAGMVRGVGSLELGELISCRERRDGLEQRQGGRGCWWCGEHWTEKGMAVDLHDRAPPGLTESVLASLMPIADRLVEGRV